MQDMDELLDRLANDIADLADLERHNEGMRGRVFETARIKLLQAYHAGYELRGYVSGSDG